MCKHTFRSYQNQINKQKKKRILKEQPIDLDGIENIYLLGDKLAKKLSKNNFVKEKSRTNFVSLERSLAPDISNMLESFWACTLPQNNLQQAKGRWQGDLLLRNAPYRKSKSSTCQITS